MNAFPTSIVRGLTRSEEMFAQTHNFVGLTAHVTGPLDIETMSTAFDALLEVHPVLGGHLERSPDGRHHIAVDDFVHPGIVVEHLADPTAEPSPMQLDQTELLLQLRLVVRAGQVEPTLFIHHCIADGHHQFALVEELFATYTSLVGSGRIPDATAQPAPVALENVLAERGVARLKRSGLERFVPAMFAYELPPSRRAATDETPALPMRVPATRCLFTESHTHLLASLCRAQGIRMNSLLSAAILLAEWQIRNTPGIPLPYLYPVDLRYILSPPVSATGCTNPLGIATYLARIDRDTGIVDLAKDIADCFRSDVADGVVQQSLLHFSPQYVGNPPGLPDVVMFTYNGFIPPLPTPREVHLTGCHSEMYFAVNAGIDMYSSGIFAERLFIEHHSHAPGRERPVEPIRSLLEHIAGQQDGDGGGG